MEIRKLIKLGSKDYLSIEGFSFEILDDTSFNNYMHTVNYKSKDIPSIEGSKSNFEFNGNEKQGICNSRVNEKVIIEALDSDSISDCSDSTTSRSDVDLIEIQFLNCCKLLDEIFKEAEEALLS
jgi:hypothetical protein